MQGSCWLHIGISRCLMLRTYSMILHVGGDGDNKGYQPPKWFHDVPQTFHCIPYVLDDFMCIRFLIIRTTSLRVKTQYCWNIARNTHVFHDPTLKTPLEKWTGLEPINITQLKMIIQNFMFRFKIFIFGVIQRPPRFVGPLSFISEMMKFCIGYMDAWAIKFHRASNPYLTAWRTPLIFQCFLFKRLK